MRDTRGGGGSFNASFPAQCTSESDGGSKGLLGEFRCSFHSCRKIYLFSECSNLLTEMDRLPNICIVCLASSFHINVLIVTKLYGSQFNS